MVNLWVIFLTGLTVGGLTCLAVQGGLLASVIAEREKEIDKKSQNAKHALYATATFLIFKYVAYIILGFLLGAFGGALNISSEFQTLMQLVAGTYMILVALNLLNVHPIFRYIIIQPPRFLTRLVHNQSKSKDIFAPAILGVMTIFIPCGTTLAMEALAISSANALVGASIMGAFILGTMPMFLGIGFLTGILGEKFRNRFLKLAAILVIYLGITSVNGALTAFGSPITLQTLSEKIPVTISTGPDNGTKIESNITTNQNPTIVVTSRGYSPNYISVKKGEIVNLTLKSQDAYSCALAFRIPAYGIKKNLAPNDVQTISFTPQDKGKVLFSCSMGMYTGVIDVI